MNIGIQDADRKAIVDGLSRLLADTYTLYLTTHNFHWNVTGPHFNSLHAMFMTQYTELWNAVDPIAERIRALGYPAPGSYRAYGSLTSLEEAPAAPPAALTMVNILAEGQSDGTAIGRIGDGPKRARQCRQQMLRPRYTVIISAYRTETIIRGHRAIAKAFDLLQHRIRATICEHIARNQKNRQAVDMGQCGGGHHIRGTRPN